MANTHSMWIAAALAVGCGGGAAPAQSPESVESEPASEAASASATDAPTDAAAEGEGEADEASESKLPIKCAGGSGAELCLPNPKFAQRLCADFYPSMALYLFQSDSPWTRGYVTRKTKAWNASGGASEPVQLEFDEEVLILRKRSSNTGGIQVSGAGGGYDAIRWDGTCVTLGDNELTTNKPPKAKNAKVEWKQLDGNIRESLRESETVTKVYRQRRKECKGVSMGTVSLKCVKADEKLSRVIVEFVRDGGKLAMPRKVP